MGALSPGAECPFPSAAPASVSALVACVCSQELASSHDPPGVGVDHPESQEVFRWKLEACLQYGRGCLLWG